MLLHTEKEILLQPYWKVTDLDILLKNFFYFPSPLKNKDVDDPVTCGSREHDIRFSILLHTELTDL